MCWVVSKCLDGYLCLSFIHTAHTQLSAADFAHFFIWQLVKHAQEQWLTVSGKQVEKNGLWVVLWTEINRYRFWSQK